MNGPGLSIGVGASAALTGAALLEIIGPAGPAVFLWGGCGGLTRWLAARMGQDQEGWSVLAVRFALGGLFALGFIAIAAPFVLQSMGADSSWARGILSAEEAKNGIAYFLGLFSTEIIAKLLRQVEKKDVD